jgi:hypothetical protein
MMVAVLAEGETLAESPALRHLDDAEYQVERERAVEITQTALSRRNGQDLTTFAKKTTRELRKAGLEFHFGVSARPLTPGDVAQQQGISPENLKSWTEAFNELNQELPEGLYLLPHVYDAGRPIPENRLRSAREVTAEYLEGPLGVNRAEDRLVLLHKKFTGLPAETVGNYRLAIHEMGHALDHLLDRVTGFPGFGTLHRETVDALYEADLKKAEELGVEKVFTTTRASEDVREYFAEAVEAYLTFPGEAAGETFRTENSRPGLQAKNPKLHDYMETLMSTDFSLNVPPGPPPRPLFPEFVPDPDTAVIFLR